MKRILFYTYLLLFFAKKGSAFDFFQGFIELGVGCFPTFSHESCQKTLVESYDPVFKPASDNTPNTMFFLFTPTNPNTAELLHECGGMLTPNTTFDVNCPTEIFIHGWLDGVCRTAWMREMKEQLFLRSKCFNVILVDWTWGNTPDLNLAKYNAKVVGVQVAYVLTQIAKQKNYDSRKFHIIGQSYGGYAAGYTGLFMRDEYILGRITALDYAFVYMPPSEPTSHLLNPSDALFVDAIHTNGGECMPILIGDSKPLGHVEFYVNGGVFVPACIPYILTSLLKLDLLYGILSILPNLCSHVHSIQIYKVSINAHKDNNNQLIGIECESKEDFFLGKCSRYCDKENTKCLVVGMDTPLYYNGSDGIKRNYYVPTSLTCPYVDHTGFTGLPLTPIRKELY